MDQVNARDITASPLIHSSNRQIINQRLDSTGVESVLQLINLRRGERWGRGRSHRRRSIAKWDSPLRLIFKRDGFVRVYYANHTGRRGWMTARSLDRFKFIRTRYNSYRPEGGWSCNKVEDIKAQCNTSFKYHFLIERFISNDC